MSNNKLLALKLYSYLNGIIKGDQPLIINGETVVEVLMGNTEYYLSAETGRFFPQECVNNPQQKNCISNFVLDITQYRYAHFSDIVNNDTTIQKISLVAKGIVQQGINDIIFSSNSDGCYFGTNYTIAPFISNNGYFLSDSRCFAEKGNVSSDVLSLVGLHGGMPASQSLFRALQECEFFHIDQRTIGELANHLLGAASSSMSKVADYLLQDVVECALSMGNRGQHYNLESFPELSSNHTLALTDLQDDHYNNDTSSYSLPLVIMMGMGATVLVGISMSFGYWLGKRGHHEMNSRQEDLDSLTISSVESMPLAGGNDDILRESEI